MGKSRNRKGKVSPGREAPSPQRTEDEEKQDLVKEFGEFVEESLIILFLREQGFQAAHETLANISANVRDEEESGFDPSGLQSGITSPVPDSADAVSSLQTLDRHSSGQFTATTSAYESGSGSQTTPDKDWRSVASDLPTDDSSTVAILRGIFPTLKESDVTRALKQSGDDADKAIDILLNLEHLEQTGQRAKGIDAFFQPDDSFSHNRGKKRNRASRLKSPKPGREVPLALEYKLAPLNLDSEETAGEKAKAKSYLLPQALSLDDTAALLERVEVARHTREASSQSFASASSAARRGRSDPLFRQVAVVYAERGHAQAHAARQAESKASDALVNEQSSDNVIDVHFVPVHDGVRIAVERTRIWWACLGEYRIRKAQNNPLQIITGAGKHSVRGFSRMFGEVGAALERDGWKVQPGIGHYYITGKK